jgi:hypothetical protein
VRGVSTRYCGQLLPAPGPEVDIGIAVRNAAGAIGFGLIRLTPRNRGTAIGRATTRVR